MSTMFTLNELKRLTVDDLIKLAKYYDVHVESNWSKAKIVEALLLNQVQNVAEAPSASETGISVRIKRIQEQNRG